MSSKTTDIKTGRIHKPKDNCNRFKQRSVAKMMGVMQEKEGGLPAEFLVSGRTGRRNAMPDILDPPHAGTSTAQLPEQLQQLATSDPDEPQPGSSGMSQQPSTSGSDQSKVQHKEASSS